eukprot:1848489-Prymnesium_polylepis.1
MLQQGELVASVLGKEPKTLGVPIGIFDVIINLLQGAADLFKSEKLEDAAEFGRIGRYYAIEDMLTTDPADRSDAHQRTCAHRARAAHLCASHMARRSACVERVRPPAVLRQVWQDHASRALRADRHRRPGVRSVHVGLRLQGRDRGFQGDANEGRSCAEASILGAKAPTPERRAPRGRGGGGGKACVFRRAPPLALLASPARFSSMSCVSQRLART